MMVVVLASVAMPAVMRRFRLRSLVRRGVAGGVFAVLVMFVVPVMLVTALLGYFLILSVLVSLVLFVLFVLLVLLFALFVLLGLGRMLLVLPTDSDG